ncbi:MAG: hypothetical protein F6K28_38475 [Microcoleus sp. SIO2G3]|nr:hypothetical protein [Microcoleus sp. SIO2G3]
MRFAEFAWQQVDGWQATSPPTARTVQAIAQQFVRSGTVNVLQETKIRLF